FVRFAESKGLIDLDSMTWARKPDANIRYTDAPIKKPSSALKTGDIILVKVVGDTFKSDRLNKMLTEMKRKYRGRAGAKIDLPDFKQYAQVELEQEPQVEGALLSID